MLSKQILFFPVILASLLFPFKLNFYNATLLGQVYVHHQ